MLENNSDNLKRFGPPSQRNRSLNRRKSGDRFEKINFSHGIDGDKSQSSIARNFSSVDPGDTGSSYIQNESTHIGLVALDGCSTSEAAQLLNEPPQLCGHSFDCKWLELKHINIYAHADHSTLFILGQGWAATMHSYNDQSIDLSERPIMYSGASGTSWGHLKLPHQMDFAAELRRAIHNAQPNVTQISGGQG